MAGLTDGLLPYRAPAMDNPFVTPGDQQRERVSAAFGWDVGRPWQQFGNKIAEVIPFLPLGGRVPTGRYRLSPNMDTTGGFDHLIMRGHFPLGRGIGHVSDNGRTAYIANIGGIGVHPHNLGSSVVANDLGPSAMRRLMEAFRRDYPQVDTFTGFRISGARKNDTRQIVRMPSGQLELPLPRSRR